MKVFESAQTFEEKDSTPSTVPFIMLEKELAVVPPEVIQKLVTPIDLPVELDLYQLLEGFILYLLANFYTYIYLLK